MPSFVITQSPGRRLVVPAVLIAALLATGYFLIVIPAGLSLRLGTAQPSAEGGASAGPEEGGGGAVAVAAAQAKPAAAAPKRGKPKIAAAVDVSKRCAGTAGDWCGPYLAQTPIPAKAPPQFNNSCLWGCNFVGVCDHHKGWCRCPAGWQGDDCTFLMKRPCSQFHREAGFEPYTEPTDVSKPGLHLRCSGFCDDDIAACYCPSNLKYGRIPADPQEPPGSPPKQHGRILPFICQPHQTEDGKETVFGDVDREKLFGQKGWCEAEAPEWHCGCLLDGLEGPTCEVFVEHFCPNQCNGHGECYLGFCKCHEGWWGTDCANRLPGVPWSEGMEAGDRPWLAPHVHTPAARDPAPGATRRRPLIYIYELPPRFNAHLLQYRADKGTCVHRRYGENNATVHIDPNVYNTETGLHEMLMQSEHRTLDPEEADFFYMPAYTTCLVFPILYQSDFPMFHSGPIASRPQAGLNYLLEVLQWVKTHHPYWDRNGGKDHIVVAAHDEGSCWVPADLRPAIILAHFGNTLLDHISGSGFGPDNYSYEATHPVYQPEGHVGKLGHFACYDPKKDLVIPSMFSPAKYESSPLLGAPTRERDILGFFRGRLQQKVPLFSRGIRQFLANTSRDEDWWGKHRIHINETAPPDDKRSYSEQLASSVFCLTIMGDGWSSRFEDSLLHGCIPVIIQDNIEVSWSSLLDMDAFSMRVAQKDMARLPEILLAVPKERVAAMQAAIPAVWRRYVWSGFRPHREAAAAALRENAKREDTQASLPPRETKYEPSEDDALDTLIQWLYTRIPP